MEKKLKLPIGIDSFQEIRVGGYVYVDKTKEIKELVWGCKYLFMTRPKGFGKSLLLSTLEAYFEGKRELFEGLYIYDCDTEEKWTPYPVIRFRFDKMTDFSSEEALDRFFDEAFSRYEEIYGLKADSKSEYGSCPSIRFWSLLRHVHEKTGKRVVVLVDEYDAPMLNTLDNIELCKKFRHTIIAVFCNLKSCDEHIHFALMTGVERFSLTSIFGGVNNLMDETFSDDCAAICGITDREMKQYLTVGIKELAEEMKISEEVASELLKSYYGGYRFSREDIQVFNPDSLLRALSGRKIEDYWLQECRLPQAVMDMLKKGIPTYNDDEDRKIYASSSDFRMCEPEYYSRFMLMYDQGFLTIKEYIRERGFSSYYLLGIPNKEMEDTLAKLKEM